MNQVELFIIDHTKPFRFNYIKLDWIRSLIVNIIIIDDN
ncbi:MAG: hypothetical protein J07HQW2_03521 [Haloquadratum walsbyi J07HQW2]|uniref:Uncharacterized protein n=1 Tax=Haloquadratum walsbyi J07HQW2 TaxID=1238425 RepID=U1NIK2_9EURY|nr:MAG: hypothetical protein J07HQW2_03521 [Haloquadratum walsbyi J07HQW2]